MKSDIEDLLSLISGAHSRVTLTTCFGLCNHSPNMKLKSTGGRSLRSHRGKLVNDGGFRMRIDDTKDDNGLEEEDETRSASDTATISNVTIEKVAEVTDLKMPHAVRAIQCKTEGNKCLLDGRYEDALECYSRGREEMCRQHETENDGDDLSPAASLLASLWLSSARSRLQWESKINETDARIELLRLSAGDALRILSTNSKAFIVGSNSDIHDMIHDVIGKLIHCSAGFETRKFSPCEIVLRDGSEEPVPITNDVKVLSAFCVVLADAWSGLAITRNTAVNSHTHFSDGALAAYRGALAIASATKIRIFRAKERRRIVKALSALSS